MATAAAFLLVAIVGCERAEPPPPAGPGTIHSEPFPARTEPAPEATLFELLAPERTGVDFANRLVLDHPMSFLNYDANVSGGVCIGDVDGDGRQDLFFTNGPGPNKLYLQRRDFEFSDATGASGVDGGSAWGNGAALVDIDGDSDLDIYVCNYDAPNQLYLNRGAGERFVEAASRYGLSVVDACLMPAFADYDNDGDLDLYLLTNRYHRPGGRPATPPVGSRDGKPYILPAFEKYYELRRTGASSYTVDTCGRPDRLLRQEEDGTFTDVSDAAGIRENGHGLSVTWWDYNRDGFIDIYVGNDFTDPDHLYRNDGNGTFTDVIADVMPYTTWSSMGADCGDIDNDGRLDFMSADMAATTHYKAKISMGEMGTRRWVLENAWPRQAMRNTVYLDTGTGRFMEVAYLCKLASTDWTWAVKMADYDNDGRVDVFVSNGASRMSTDADVPVPAAALIGRTDWDIWKDQPALKEQNIAFRNEGDFHFADVSHRWGLDSTGMSYAAAHGDIDGDGDLDLVVVDLDTPASIYRNREAARRRVTVELRGAGKNRHGIGALLHVETAAGKQIRQMNPMTGFLSTNGLRLHFGLGDVERIDKLTVEWPGGHTQTFTDLATDRHYVVSEPQGAAPRRRRASRSRTWFSEVARNAGLSFVHRETPFDDYARQPLLPGKHSQLGGGLAWGDADGDGEEDLFVAGAAGQAGRLFLHRGAGRFEPGDPGRAFEADRACEDMAPLWFDADSDGDMDLLVTSGGVECAAGDALLEDRLYLNNGKGRFRRAPEGTLPAATESSSVAVAADIDADGDLDLFIGGRLIPGQYPETPASRLLRNDGGKFVDITKSFAPGLERVGLVTGALWSDADGDGRPDLLVTLEWGPVKLFVHRGESLEERTRAADLENRRGWWNSIAGADLDRDGDIDYVVMNVGLNTKYGEPSASKPALLYYGDMEGNGRKRLIEAKPDASGVVPVRGRSCSSSAIPMVAERFPTYRSFAASHLEEIYTASCLEAALELRADHFDSGVLWNDGAGRFRWESLPRFAQASPGYGVVAADLDGDGYTEIHAVQNLYTREPETGLWRGGIGFTLRAAAGGRLEIVPPSTTDLVVDGDAKGLTVCDINGDGWPDLAVTQNNSRLLVFRNNGAPGAQPLRVRLRGKRGNPVAAGARVTVTRADGLTQTAEVHAGSGYLSQSSAALFFGSGASPIKTVRTRWPDGAMTVTEVAPEARRLEVVHPANR